MIRDSFGDRFMVIFIYVFLTVLAFTTLYPFWNAIVISLNTGIDTSRGGVTFWPREFTLENYEIVFSDKRLMTGFFVSIARTIVGTITSIMGLMDSFWVFIIPALISVWNMIIFRTFFQGLPAGLEESAKIDGCGNWGTFFRIVLPLSGPVIATLALFTAVGHWNEWFLASIYISNENLLPIQTILKQILASNISSEQMANLDSAALSRLNALKTVTSKSLSMATMMVATLPIVMVYPFVQKYFVKGVLVGSLKE